MLVMAGSLVAWYAIIQHARGSPYVLNLPRPPLGNMKASGTYISPNHFADLMAILIVVAASIVWGRHGLLASRLVAGYAILVCLPALFLSESRSGWLGLAAGLLVFGVAAAARHGAKRLILTGAVMLMVLSTAAFALWTYSPNFSCVSSGRLPTRMSVYSCGKTRFV